jgi:MarR family transcriptional regulator for hemolysin
MSTAPDDVAIEGSREPKRTIGLRLSTLARALRNNFDREVAALSVTRSQWAMIAVVAHRPGATQRLISETLEMSEASAGRLIDRLCADGLLERRERNDDRRARAIYISDAAEPLLGKLEEFAERVESRLLRGFSPEEITQLEEYLDRIATNAARG